MPMPSSDVLVIGGGTNGLACAARLASDGRKVTLIEAAEAPGGAATGWDFAPGFRSPGLAHLVNLLDRRVVQGMDLRRHGLSLAPLASTALSATGDHLVLEGAFGARLQGDITPADRIAWEQLRETLLAFAGVLAPFKEVVPPRLARNSGAESLKLAKLGLAVRMLGKDRFREFLRMLLINVRDVLDDDLSDDRLKGLVGFDATLGSWLAPRSPNSLILLLNRLAGEVNGRPAVLAWPQGGIDSVARAMAAAATAAGVTIRTNARAETLVFEAGQAAGVRLADGETLYARTIVSAMSPRTTFLSLVGPRNLDAGFTRRIRDQKTRGAVARLNLALSGTPDFRGADLRSRLVIAPDLDTVERAFNAVKYGEVPKRPVMELVLPSAHDPGFAPAGQHVLSALVQFAPHDPKAGLAAARDAMLENSLAMLEEHSPNLRGLITHAELLMPQDIEARFGMAGGNWHHGELSVEQMLFLRPLPGISRHATPIDNLCLASAGCHPGGGISGAAGWNAAGQILSEVRA